MTAPAQSDHDFLDPRSPAFAYVVLCAASLAVLLLVMLYQEQSLAISVLIAFVGAGGLLARMRLAPLLVTILVAITGIMHQRNVGGLVSNVLLCAAVLGYVASHYRLQGAGRFIFPPDRRLRPTRKPLSMQSALWHMLMWRRRSPLTVRPAEQALLAVSLPFWALAARLAWYLLDLPHDVLEWRGRIVHMTVYLLVLIPGLTVAAALLQHGRRRRMTRQEATLLLQDTLWNETRGEQRWFTRWLAWFWLKQKEQP